MTNDLDSCLLLNPIRNRLVANTVVLAVYVAPLKIMVRVSAALCVLLLLLLLLLGRTGKD